MSAPTTTEWLLATLDAEIRECKDIASELEDFKDEGAGGWCLSQKVWEAIRARVEAHEALVEALERTTHNLGRAQESLVAEPDHNIAVAATIELIRRDIQDVLAKTRGEQ